MLRLPNGTRVTSLSGFNPSRCNAWRVIRSWLLLASPVPTLFPFNLARRVITAALKA